MTTTPSRSGGQSCVLALLDALVNRACVQAGPGPTDRDIDYVELVAVCREAETLLYETGWHRE